MTLCKCLRGLWGYVSQIETILFVVLVSSGTWLIYHPVLDNKGASATLVGALWGGAAILLGNGLNRHYEHERNIEELEKKRTNLRTLLMTEIVRIMVNHMKNSRFFALSAEKAVYVNPKECLSRVPPDPNIFSSLIGKMVDFPEKEIDALATFYGNLDMTRKLMRETAAGGDAGMLASSKIADAIKHDCEVAAEVVSLIAPNRKIEMSGEKPELFVDLLRKAAEGNA